MAQGTPWKRWQKESEDGENAVKAWTLHMTGLSYTQIYSSCGDLHMTLHDPELKNLAWEEKSFCCSTLAKELMAVMAAERGSPFSVWGVAIGRLPIPSG